MPANPHPIKISTPETTFEPKDAIKSATKGFLFGGATGFVTAAVQNALVKEHVGAGAVFTRFGGTMVTFTAVPTVYTFTRDATANLRQKDDTLNHTIGAFLGGATLGIRSGRIPHILGFGALFSVVMTVLDYTGGSIRGRTQVEDPLMDDFTRKEMKRLNRRRPIEETIANIGEGRGIEPPGYEERRRQRLKERYGVDINPVSARVE